MSEDRAFVDYYNVLQVHPDCDAKMLESAYHHLAKLYHPDHAEVADVDRFNAVIKAYRVLRNPEQRAEYDRLYAAHQPRWSSHPFGKEVDLDQKTALDDAEAHERILIYLYKARRERAQDAGVAAFYLREMLNCSDESFDFHMWYLKEKGFVNITEQGTLAITIQGVDHVISTSRTAKAEKLLIGRSNHSQDDAGPDGQGQP